MATPQAEFFRAVLDLWSWRNIVFFLFFRHPLAGNCLFGREYGRAFSGLHHQMSEFAEE
jgi:hypothetical protein